MDLWFWFLLSMAMNVVVVLLALNWCDEAQTYKEAYKDAEHWQDHWWRKVAEKRKAKDSLIQQCKYWAKKARG